MYKARAATFEAADAKNALPSLWTEFQALEVVGKKIIFQINPEFSKEIQCDKLYLFFCNIQLKHA